MRLKVLACETLFREVYLAAAASPHICDVKLLSRECHDDLQHMHRVLQEEIDLTNASEREHLEPVVRCPVCSDAQYDAVVLAMGLCGNTVNGLKAVGAPLVLSRVHDCSGSLLGGNERYLNEEKRSVFYHQGAVERLGVERVDAVPRRLGLGRTLGEYIQDYGEDNGRYIYEMERNFATYNDRALVLTQPTTPEIAQRCEADVQQYASQFGWKTVTVPVRSNMITGLLSGAWDDDEFVVVPQGRTLELSVSTTGDIESS